LYPIANETVGITSTNQKHIRSTNLEIMYQLTSLA
jgi:hypothetical protein